MVDQTSKQFGNYRLVRLLGQGGFAEVYLAEHVHLGTQAAVKILSTHLDTASIEQFRNEAQIIAHFKHPHIVRVFDFGLENGIPFFVMSYASGGTLRQKHSKGTRLPLATVVSYVNQIAPALQYAHFRKRVHRDIKPENILIEADHKLVLSDFGIAIVAHNFQSLTPQMILGTPYYMAPEQSQGQALPASDQYALGIMVYEWLTGIRPFDGSSPVEIMMKHISHIPPSLPQVIPSLSSAIEQVVMKALEKEPEKRYTSVMAFAQALDQAYQADQHPPGRKSYTEKLLYSYEAPPRSSTHSFSWMLNDPLIATGDIDGKIEVWNHRRTARLFSTQIPLLTKKLRYLALSPNGSCLACLIEDTEEKKTTLQLWSLDAGKVLASYQAEEFLLWSPDSASVAFVSAGRESGLQTLQIGKVDQPQLIATIDEPLFLLRWGMPVWSPNGRYIALPPQAIPQVGWTISIYDISVEHAPHTLLFFSSHDLSRPWKPTDFTEGGWKMRSSSSIWSPNSAYLAHYANWNTTWVHRLSLDDRDEYRMYIWRVDQISGMKTETQAPVIISKPGVETLAWSPDSTCIVSGLHQPMVEEGGELRRMSPASIEIWDVVGGKSLQTYTGHTRQVVALAWSPDKRHIASADIDGNIHIWNTDLAQCILVLESHQRLGLYKANMEWSSDGMLLALVDFGRHRMVETVQIWQVA
jgi:serine/threonine protein kinase